MEFQQQQQRQQHARARTQHHTLYDVELQDGEDVHSVRSEDLHELDEPPLPLQEHHLDRPIQLLPSAAAHHRSHHHTHHTRQQSHGDAYTNSSSDNDDDAETASVESKPASTSSTAGDARFLGHSSPNLQPSSVLALATSRKNAVVVASPGKASGTLRRTSSAIVSPQQQSVTPASSSAALERKRSVGGSGSVALAARLAAEERSVFARIYFEHQSFTSSTVFKLFARTTVLDVRKSMANKIKIPSADFAFYVIVVVFPSDSSSVSARTLRDDELMLPLVERLNRARSNTVESDDALGTIRPKPKHRTPPPVKFILKDVRGAPLDLDEPEKKAPVEVQALHFPVLVGKGVHSGYLQKASVKDPNVWRKRWFVVKGDQLLYSKSSSNPRDVTSVSLLNAYLAKARPELRIAHAFELRTPRRVYQLCASTKDEYVAWVHALHVQICISGDNHRLYEAEIMITEDAVARSEDETYRSRYAEPSLLQQVIAREDTLKIFRDFVANTPSQVLLDTWIECELFRRACLARETARLTGNSGNSGSGSGRGSSRGNRAARRTAQDEWDHLRVIMEAIQTLSMIESDEIVMLRQSFTRTEQISRRLNLAMHSAEAAAMEFPRVELIASIHQKIFKAIECGPFQQFLMADGFRQVLRLMVGRTA